MFDAKNLLESVFGNAPPPADARPNANADAEPPASPAGPTGGLEDMLKNLTGGGTDFSDILAKVQAGGGEAANALRDILGQAVQGTREGAGEIGKAAGVEDIVKRMSGGRSSEEMLAQLKALIAKNQLAAGAALGGLGALVLGTQTGRSLAVGAAKLGALALIGGLAYKAHQNYAKGQSPASLSPEAPAPAPNGSGFEPAAISNDSAALYLRAMIAAAAADGRVDDAERAKIVAGLGQGGVESEAAQFVERELKAPASIDDLGAAVTSKEEAARVYTAARVAIDPDGDEERAFLAKLASRLGVDDALAAHIDATARGAAA